MPPAAPQPEQIQQVVLFLSLGNEFARGVVRGVSAYIRPRRPWNCSFGSLTDEYLELLRKDPPAGAVFVRSDSPFLEKLQATGIPIVACTGDLIDPRVSTFAVDNVAVGRAAAAFLLERRHTNLAFYGQDWRPMAQDRMQGFREAVERAGHTCHTFFRSDSSPPLVDRPRGAGRDGSLAYWVQNLPKPVAIFASDDPMAFLLSEVCASLGLQVPEDVALLGVDNDEPLCEMAYPSLSSIATPAEKIGFNAARCLDALMRGEVVASEAHRFDEVRVVPRQSTGIVFTRDAHVTAALRYIQHHASDPIRVGDVVAAVPVSRRTLETRFQDVLGRGILEQIQLTHVERAKQLLRETDLIMEQVAELSGFNSRERLTAVFHQYVGESPSSYRKAVCP